MRLSTVDRLARGEKPTGFSRTEEGLPRREDAVPDTPEEGLKKRGADDHPPSVPFKSDVVEDGRLSTGQNPASAAGAGAAAGKMPTAGV